MVHPRPVPVAGAETATGDLSCVSMVHPRPVPVAGSETATGDLSCVSLVHLRPVPVAGSETATGDLSCVSLVSIMTATGSYVGTGSANPRSGFGFKPKFVQIWSSDGNYFFCASDADAQCFQIQPNTPAGFYGYGAIDSLDPDGFTADGNANLPGIPYYFYGVG